jgi:endonuclease/exonuclease/phosphatase family metal-dependent hydrolase
MVLNAAWRIPALTQHISGLAADILCLQEVETDTFAALRARLAPAGFAAHYARRRNAQPDGCATFYRHEAFEFLDLRVIAYADGGDAPDSGDIGLVLLLRSADGVVGIANTHLAWEPPETPPAAQRGPRKIRQLLAECGSVADCQGWLICGDLNVTPDAEVVAALSRAGFRYAHQNLEETYTCSVNGRAKMIDYLFHSSALRPEPQPVYLISDHTPLPSPEQPSDHLPVVSRLRVLTRATKACQVLFLLASAFLRISALQIGIAL